LLLTWAVMNTFGPWMQWPLSVWAAEHSAMNSGETAS
jgi:hypothetical protein